MAEEKLDLTDKQIMKGIFMLALIVGGQGHHPVEWISQKAQRLRDELLAEEEEE